MPAIDLAAVPGFTDAVRQFAIGLIGVTYASVPYTVFGELANLEGGALDAAVKEYGYTREGDMLVAPPNEENQAKAQVFQENLDFKDLAPVYELLAGRS